MNWTIWKFEQPIYDEITFYLPVGAKPIKLGVQTPRCLTFWAEVGPQVVIKQAFTVQVFGTGNPGPPAANARYLDTVFDDPFVWHVYAV